MTRMLTDGPGPRPDGSRLRGRGRLPGQGRDGRRPRHRGGERGSGEQEAATVDAGGGALRARVGLRRRRICHGTLRSKGCPSIGPKAGGVFSGVRAGRDRGREHRPKGGFRLSEKDDAAQGRRGSSWIRYPGRSSSASLRRLRRRHAGHRNRGPLAQPAIEDAAEDAAEERCDPEQPELSDGPSADEHGRSGAARRVHRQVRDRDTDEVDKGQAQPDGERREPDRCLAVGRRP